MANYIVIPCLFFLLLTGAYSDDETTLCTEKYCKDFECKTANDNVPVECTIQNVTHSGIFLPYPGPCNCCDYCLKNLDEGENCLLGEAGQPPTSSICGDLLSCQGLPGAGELDDGECQVITNTECTEKQQDYDKRVIDGTTGHLELREICERRGLYGDYKCIPGEICYCRTNTNERLFGEILYTSTVAHILNCECSKSYYTTSKFLGRDLHVGEHLRCQPNGDYDTIQCIDDECFCVDALDGVRTYPNAAMVNVTEINNKTLSCFNHDVHMEGEYYRPCEVEYLETLETIKDFEDDTHEVIGITLPDCQLDGYYALVQKNKTHYYCSDAYGGVLENFIIDINEEANLAKDMNCACARTRSLIATEKPDCLPNGNYDPKQCRRGYCRCVDINGNQIGKEISIDDENKDPCSPSAIY